MKRIILHNIFSVAADLDYDFALLELELSISFNEKAQPIQLVNKNEEISDDTICLVTGWGLTKSPYEPREHLRGLQVPIINFQKCMYSSMTTNSNGFLVDIRNLAWDIHSFIHIQTDIEKFISTVIHLNPKKKLFCTDIWIIVNDGSSSPRCVFI